MSADGNGGKQQESGQKTAIQSTTGRIGSVLHQLPTVVVLLVIGAIGVWGHRTGWKAPHLSELRTPDSAAKEDWCTLHNVPLSRCVKCKPELLGENKKDWCPEHGVPESRCTLCHPEILHTGVAGDWCREHGVPETSCTICHPEIAVRSAPPAQESTVRVTRSQPAGTSPAPQYTSVRFAISAARTIRTTCPRSPSLKSR